MSNPNIGWLFYRDYFKGLKEVLARPKDQIESHFVNKNNRILNQSVHTGDLPDLQPRNTVYLKTTYPGLLIGTGYQHETASLGEFKIGFYFDYSSGLPVIPGSSVKGVLRSVFPYHKKDLGGAFRKPRIDYVRSLVKAELSVDITDQQVEWLEREIFEGLNLSKGTPERNSLYERDIFHDAVISPYGLDRPDGKILGSDFITPHSRPLKDPVPLQMLRVVPGVVFQFHFDLQDSQVLPELTAVHKQNIFTKILMARGIGAKTNVGYGHFSDVTQEIEKSLRSSVEKAAREDMMGTQTDEETILELIGFQTGKENRYPATITDENDAYYQFTLKNDVVLVKSKRGVMKKIEGLKKRRTKKKQSTAYSPLTSGTEVVIRVNEDAGSGFSFAVLPVWS